MSEKDIASVETEKETQKWPLPFNIGINKLDLIVKAFFQAGADVNPVSLRDIVLEQVLT
jgi:hypothetical protein